MTAAETPSPLAYDDLDTPAQMVRDARAAGANLAFDPTLPAPSLRYEDYRNDRPKPEIRVPDAARAIADALDLHLG